MYLDTIAVSVADAPTGSTNAVVVSGDERLLVDPADETDALDAAATEGIDHVAVTHTHPDHAGGVRAYAKRTDATVWAKQGREERFRQVTGVTPDRTFREGTAVGPARVLDTGGHAPDHVAFDTPVGTLCGDLAVAAGSVAVAHPDGDMRAYLTALRRLHARNPSPLVPGHGPTITDTREVCARLIAHRLDRERRVRAAVEGDTDDSGTVNSGTGESEPMTTAAITDAVYEKDVSDVRSLAEATVRAHLAKLDREGTVVWDRATDTASPP